MSPVNSPYTPRLADHNAGKAAALVAEYNGEVAGYLNVYFDADAGPYNGLHLPELVDFGVLEKFRRKGIGTKLMDVAEQIASEKADTVVLAVGLHSGYGSAQRMYVKRGYVPDGSGVWYGDENIDPGKDVCNDDDLMLFLSKDLRK
mgnify:CR=1 FL=1